jgi:hypothetical protein
MSVLLFFAARKLQILLPVEFVVLPLGVDF